MDIGILAASKFSRTILIFTFTPDNITLSGLNLHEFITCKTETFSM